jgi:FdhD protein
VDGSVARDPGEAGEEIEDRSRGILVTDHPEQQQPTALAAMLEPAQVGMEALEVALAQAQGRAFDRRPAAAGILELDHPLTIPGELELVSVQHLHEGNVVAGGTHQGEPAQQRLVGAVVDRLGPSRPLAAGIEEVREHHHQAAPAQAWGHEIEQGLPRAVAPRRARPGLGQSAQAITARRGLEGRALDLARATDRQPHPVTLAQGEAGQRRGQGPRPQPLVRLALAVVHAPRAVGDDEQIELLLALGLAHDQALRSRGGAPVEAADLVAGHVGAVVPKVPPDPRTQGAVDAVTRPGDGPAHEQLAARERGPQRRGEQALDRIQGHQREGSRPRVDLHEPNARCEPRPATLAPVSREPEQDDERYLAIERGAWIGGKAQAPQLDLLAREEPLEIRVNQVPLAVVMRTPGDDEELVRGFLISERIVGGLEDIVDLRHCTTVDTPEAEDNVMLARLAPNLDVDLAALRRNLYASSSCGVCGKASIEAAMAVPELEGGRLPLAVRVEVDTLVRLPERLRARQEIFEHTGGLHAAGLFAADGRLHVVREDVGRHNAVDKVIGWGVREGVAFERCVLMVSGRVSFEIVQKALAVAIPVVAAVSAPTSLAVQLARRAGMTLVGFVREERLCVYAGAGRIVGREGA